MILLIEIVTICILFTIITILGTLKDPTADLKNAPIPLQEYVASLPEYADLHIIHTKERLTKKIPAGIFALVLFTVLIKLTGADTFVTGFRNTLILWVSVKLFVTLVLTCGWYAHTKKAWVPGTEDHPELYQDYKFYLSSIPRSVLVGVILAVIIGCICAI